MKQEIINNLQELEVLAEQIANSAKHIICLEGDLGAGKTEFSRCFINFLAKKAGQKQIQVTSPTYNIVQSYEISPINIHHFDLYRVNSADELPEIGFEDFLENSLEGDFCLIEWPEIADEYLKKYARQILTVKIEIIDENKRRISISG